LRADANPSLVWFTQLAGTLVIGAAVYLFFRSGSPFGPPATEAWWSKYSLGGILLASVPSLVYLRKHKARIDEDMAAVRATGKPDPARRSALLQSLTAGGVLCDLPQAVGVLYLMFGSEMRWFLGATLITVSLRLSYRPFTR